MCDATSGDRRKLETQSREREWGGVTMIRGEHIYHFVWVGEKVHFGNIRRRLHDRVQFSARDLPNICDLPFSLPFPHSEFGGGLGPQNQSGMTTPSMDECVKRSATAMAKKIVLYRIKLRMRFAIADCKTLRQTGTCTASD